MKNYTLNKVLISTLILTSCIIYYVVVSLTYRLSGFNMIENDFVKLIIGTNKILSFFTPLIIFLFFVVTSKMMFILYDIEIKNIQIWEIISTSFLPVFFNYIFFLFISVDMTERGVLNYKSESYFGLSIARLEDILSYL